MITFAQSLSVFLHRKPVDFRKQINGLSVIVQEGLMLDPFSESCFVFSNRQCDRIKILYWHRNGFCLWMKRLEKDKFAWPRHVDNDAVVLTAEELHWLLDGFDIWQKPPHPIRRYAAV
jgi:transposase